MFGVKAQDGSLRTVSSGRTYNDNQWHQITATMSTDGMKLYVDGVRVGQRTDTTVGEAYLGYWRVGGDIHGLAQPARATTTSSATSTRSRSTRRP